MPVGLVRGFIEGGCGWLHSLWVSPQVRGQGLGSQLVVAVEEWAAGQGATYLRLEVVPDNAPLVHELILPDPRDPAAMPVIPAAARSRSA